MSDRIRIGFALPHFRPGGAERVVLNLLRKLDRARFEPFLFLARREGDFLGLLPEDVTVIELGERRARRLPPVLKRELGAQHIDVVYSATNAMNLALLAGWRGRGGRPLRIVSEHTPPGAYLAEAKHRWLRLLLMRRLYRRADAVAVPLAAIGEELEALLGPLPLRVLPNPVIDELPPIRARRQDKLRIVAAGRLVEAKGFDLLVEAAGMLKARGLAFELDIFGEGPEGERLRQTIAARDITKGVRLRGHAADLLEELSRADLFVLSSRREGFGNVVVEAMAAGVPVLATDCPGPAALIRDGETGYLVPSGDAAALAAGMERLLASPELADGVVATARSSVHPYLTGEATRAFERSVLELLGAASIG